MADDKPPKQTATNADILREVKSVRAELAQLASLVAFGFWILVTILYVRTRNR